MKKKLLSFLKLRVKPLLVLCFFIVNGCFPSIVKNGENKYSIIDWEGGTFAYITYTWNGGDFSEAIKIGKKFYELSIKRGLGETHMGIFPNGKKWYIGILLKGDFDITEINSYPIEKKDIPAGKYAKMILKGHPERMFLFYKKFKKMLEKKGYKVKSPVYEIWNKDTFNNPELQESERWAEIRYMVE